MINLKAASELPSTCGVYYFISKKNEIVYIGKAINLRARAISHVRAASQNAKEQKIIYESVKIEYHTTLGEFEALVLEATEIGKYKPKYNVQWRDDRSYLYIKVTQHEVFPKIHVVRKETDGKSLYYGPFQSTRRTYQLVANLREIVPFCTQRRLGKRSCFYSKIGKCNPCPTKINLLDHDSEEYKLQRKSYLSNIARLKKILSGNMSHVITDFQKDLKVAIYQNNFEEGIVARNKLLLLNQLLIAKRFNSVDTLDLKSAHITVGEIELFLSRLGSVVTKDTYRFEGYDNSVLFGKEATGVMVVFENGESAKNHYRRFKLGRTVKSDTKMMEELFQRRFKHHEWQMPDLIIIDGGKPQLRVVKKIFKSMNINIPFIGIAKRPDRLINGLTLEPIPINPNTPVFRLIQEVRDESHRYARKYHLLLRHKTVFSNFQQSKKSTNNNV